MSLIYVILNYYHDKPIAAMLATSKDNINNLTKLN